MADDPSDLLFSGYRSIFLGGKAAGTKSSPFTSIYSELKSDWSYAFFLPSYLLDVEGDNISNNR